MLRQLLYYTNLYKFFKRQKRGPDRVISPRKVWKRIGVIDVIPLAI